MRRRRRVGLVRGPGSTRLAAAFAAADVHPLLCAVAHRTGDLGLLRAELRARPVPDARPGTRPRTRAGGRGPSPRRRSVARPRRVGRGRPRADTRGAPGSVRVPRRARRPPAQWETFLAEELALSGDDPREPSWHLRDTGRSFRCAVIGAGASGLAAAHRLRQAGIEVTVLEKNSDVGGTWLENVYPGCRVDVPEPALQLLLRGDQRLGVALLRAARPVGLSPGVAEGARTGGVHPLRLRGDRGALRRALRHVAARAALG